MLSKPEFEESFDFLAEQFLKIKSTLSDRCVSRMMKCVLLGSEINIFRKHVEELLDRYGYFSYEEIFKDYRAKAEMAKIKDNELSSEVNDQ